MHDVLQVTKTGRPNSHPYCLLLDIAFDRALARQSAVSEETLQITGMSGQCYRMFINNMIRLMVSPRYLEVGSWAGSTACSAIDKNVLKATCIDNWSQFGGPKDAFLKNIENTLNKNVDFNFIENDFRKVDISSIGSYNIYLFDGPHEEKDQFDGLALYDRALDDDFVFIVDDWNWEPVRTGTFRAIKSTGFSIDYCIEIRTTLNDDHAKHHGTESDWHNGYFISKLSRRDRRS